MNVSTIEIATRRKVLSELKKNLAQLTDVPSAEIKRLNRVRPSRRLKALDSTADTTQYLQAAVHVTDDRLALNIQYQKVQQAARALERQVLEYEREVQRRG